ncbi:MAG: hypothetical protein H6732_08700 [Alphaproteobacteria bacterium]|nr:hypothetical protein [Alphaproteobacteria bacterium]
MEQPPEAGLEDVERAVRPLRRVLARGGADRARLEPHFAAALARLAGPLQALVLAPELVPLRDEITAPLLEAAALGDDARADRLAAAWQALARLDGVLGLPLRSSRILGRPTGRRRVRLTRVEEPRPERPPKGSRKGARDKAAAREPQATAVAEPAAPTAPPQPPPRATARLDAALADTELDEGTTEALAAVGITTVWEALRRAPAEVCELTPVHGAGRELPDGEVAVGGRLGARWTTLTPDGGSASGVYLHGAGVLRADLRRALSGDELVRWAVGRKVVLSGSVADGRLGEAWLARTEQGRALQARYAPEDGGEALAEAVDLLLDDGVSLDDPLSGAALGALDLPRLDAAIARLHAGDPDGARRRLAFDEALLLQLGMSFPRFANGDDRGLVQAVGHRHVGELTLRGLGPALPDDAQVVLEGIKRDLRDGSPGARLLHGGSDGGQVDVALQAILTVVEARGQVLVVAPDAPLAAVLHDRWEEALRAFGIVPLLLSGDPRRGDADALRRGEAHVAFASQSAWDHGLEWRRLALVIGVEQQTYGDTALRVRGLRSPRPDLVVVVRTPLPLDVWWGAYPSLDAARLQGSPRGAEGTVWREPERTAAYAALGEAVREGRSGLVAFPMRRGGTDLLSPRELDQVIASLRSEVLGDATLAIFHGAHTGRERVRAYTDWIERRAQVLVATTLVEWMPPAPRGVVGLVEHADRVDPQRLLALRALVTPRGHLHCVVGEAADPRAVDRVALQCAGAPDAEVCTRFPQGYEIAAAATASPPAHTRWLRPAEDADLLDGARALVHRLLREDAALRQGTGARLARLARAAWASLVPDAPCPLPEVRVAPQKRRRRRRRRR